MHGKTSEIHHDGKTIFRGLPQDFPATRYHSLIVERKSLPQRARNFRRDRRRHIMGLRHRKMRVEGVQFHPESVLTDAGFRLLENFLSIFRKRAAAPGVKTPEKRAAYVGAEAPTP